MARLNADVPDELRKELKIKLIQDDMDFKTWLIEKILEYVGGPREGKKPKK